MKFKLKIRKKWIVLMLNCLCITALMVSLFWLFSESIERNASFTYMLDESNTTANFEETERFTELFQSAIGDAIRYSVICEQFETNGELDGKKEIDIEQYANHKNVAASAEISVSYYLEDLIKWGQMNYFSYSSVTDKEYENLYNYASALSAEKDKLGTENSLINSESNESITIIIGEEEEQQEVPVSELNSAGTSDGAEASTTGASTSDTGRLQEVYEYEKLLPSEQLVTESGSAETTLTNGTTQETQQDLEDGQELKKVVADESAADDTTSTEDTPTVTATIPNNVIVTENGQQELYVSAANSQTITYYPVLYEEIFFPVDGEYLILHTNSLEEFADYTDYLATSIKMIYSNFLEYRSMGDALSRSNFKFYISYETEGVRNTYTNFLNGMILGENTTEDEITALFSENGKFIYSDYENLAEPITNTLISDQFIWGEVSRYYYSYPGNVKLWFGVDTTYSQDDLFSENKATYRQTFIRFRNVFIVTVILFIVVLLMFIVLSVYETPKRKIRGIDKLHTEFSVLIAIGLLVGIMGATAVALGFYSEHRYYFLEDDSALSRVLALVIMGGGSFIASAVGLFFYLSFVRRLKAHTIWSNSVCKRFYDLLVYLGNHPKIFVRTWIPYALFLSGNLFMMYVIMRRGGNIVSVLAGVALIVGDLLVGGSIYRGNDTRRRIIKGIAEIQNGNFEHKLDTEEMHGDNLVLAESINRLGASISNAVGVSMKDERMKTDLITNVSHDIKTPLTSIISYIDLIKRENIKNEKLQEYVNVLDNKAQRLKQLTDDLVEASKISSGNIVLDMHKLNFNQLLMQTLGEFDERFKKKGLEIVMNLPEEPLYILADSRRIWRVIENLYSNIVKYALENTRVYVDLKPGDPITLSVKNISAQELNIDATELTERFIRGDISRSTEGSGLGLSIAKDLTIAQNGKFDIYLDGDLFKVIISFHPYVEEQEYEEEVQPV